MKSYLESNIILATWAHEPKGTDGPGPGTYYKVPI